MTLTPTLSQGERGNRRLPIAREGSPAARRRRTHMPILNGPSRGPHAGGAPDSLGILLHGLGADGNDLIGLTMALGPRFPHMAFHSPDAPKPVRGGRVRPALVPIEPPDERAAGLRNAGEVVETYVGELLDEHGPDSGPVCPHRLLPGVHDLAVHRAPHEATGGGRRRPERETALSGVAGGRGPAEAAHRPRPRRAGSRGAPRIDRDGPRRPSRTSAFPSRRTCYPASATASTRAGWR